MGFNVQLKTRILAKVLVKNFKCTKNTLSFQKTNKASGLNTLKVQIFAGFKFRGFRELEADREN